MNDPLVIALLGVVISLQGWILLSIITLKVDVARIKQVLNLD